MTVDAEPFDAEREATIDPRLTALRARVPAHVVYRAFPHETVVLNLDTGLYHGLDPVAGSMLASLERSASVLAAAQEIAGRDPGSLERIASDLSALCDRLAERGLLTLEPVDDR